MLNVSGRKLNLISSRPENDALEQRRFVRMRLKTHDRRSLCTRLNLMAHEGRRPGKKDTQQAEYLNGFAWSYQDNATRYLVSVFLNDK